MAIEPLDSLAARLHELRSSATLSTSVRHASNPREALDMFVASLGFRTIGQGWHQLNKHEAKDLLKHVLEHDLAFGSAEMEPEKAAALADECLDLVGVAEYFTNGSFSRSGWSGHNVAPGTFQTGLAWVAAERVGILWVEDED